MTDSITSDNYLKVIINGLLVCKSELHIGGGVKSSDDNTEEKTLQVQYFVKGINNKAYIPGSTIKGLLAAVGEGQFSQLDSDLFGNTDYSSQLICYDAFTDAKSGKHSRTRIDPITNSAKHHHLFTYECIPKGSIFKVSLQLKNITKKDLDTFINLLLQWQKQREFAIGKNKSIGSGLLEWQFSEPQTQSIQVLTHSKLNQWLNSEKKLTELFTAYSINYTTRKTVKEKYSSYAFTITQDNCPLLINDPELVSEQEKEPDFEYIRDTEDKPYIPGSTLKGALRAQMRKILRTFLYESKEDVDTLLEPVLGHTNQSSLINFTDAGVSEKSQDSQHQQYFNIIDRFSGATNNLYLANAIIKGEYNGQLILHKDIENYPWIKELLFLACKDFEYGDLVLGWGKAKGYGRCTMTMTLPEQFYTISELTELKRKINSLTEHLKMEKAHA